MVVTDRKRTIWADRKMGRTQSGGKLGDSCREEKRREELSGVERWELLGWRQMQWNLVTERVWGEGEGVPLA